MKFPLWRRRQTEELEEEIRSHFEEAVRDRMERGESRATAEAAARREFGNVAVVREVTREMWGWVSLDRLAQDVRYGLRQLRRTPGFTLAAVLTLALGIGANTAIFSAVSAALLRPLPVESPEEVVALNNASERRAFPTFSYPNYRDLRDQNGVFAELIAYRFAPVSLSYEGVNQRAWSYLVTGNYFAGLGVRAHQGRLISPEDDRMPGAHPVAVLTYECWQKRFGGRPDIVGKSFIANGRSYAVIGVAPEGFYGTEVVAATEIWFPMAMQASIDPGANWLESRGAERLLVQGRLKPGVSRARGQANLDSIALGLARDFPDVNEGMRITLSTPGLAGSMRRPVVGFATLLMAVAGLVLLLACTNLSSLQLARATGRHEETAIRISLGASRGRLVRQLLTESMLLALGGGVVGMAPALWPMRLSVQLRPPMDFPIALDVPWDYRVLTFGFLITVATGVAFGLRPALQATRAEVSPGLKGSWRIGRRGSPSWMRGSLIAVQVALSLVLLTCGGLMLRALRQAQTLELGFEPQGAVEVTFDLRLQGYDEARGREMQRRLLERVRALPGVEAAGIADLVPVDLHFGRAAVFVEGEAVESSAKTPLALTSRVSPGYFEAMDTRLVAGRHFSDSDGETALPVTIVNVAFARQFGPGNEAIGKRFRIGNPNAPKLEVIGIVENGKYTGLGEDPKPFVYRALWQSYSGSTDVVVRSNVDPQQVIAAVRHEVQQLDPLMPLATSAPLADRLDLALLPARVAASVLGTFAILGLTLAAIGIYGVISYAVTRRTHEVGIRMALGARRADVLKLVIAQGMRPALLGAAAGLPGTYALTRLMKSVLFGLSATDAVTYGTTAGLLAAVALLACYIPARRATRVDPTVALRYE